jgi:hypothetical protein
VGDGAAIDKSAVFDENGRHGRDGLNASKVGNSALDRFSHATPSSGISAPKLHSQEYAIDYQFIIA